MMKKKVTRALLISVFVSLLSYGIVLACSPVEPRVLLKCSNQEFLIEGTALPVEGETYESRLKRRVNATIESVLAVAPRCEEDIAPALPAFEQEIIKWLDYENYGRGAFLEGDLVLEEYSTDRDTQLQKKKNNLLSCGYEEYQHVGNWLIVFRTSRSYCYEFWYALGSCPSIVLSLGHFLFYLIANFNLQSFPYLLGLLLIMTIIISALWRILQNRPLMPWWKIIVLSVAILTVELYLLVVPFWLIGQIIGWVLLFYILLLWYKQLRNKMYVFKAKAG